MEEVNEKLAHKKILNAIVQNEVIVFNTYAFPLCAIYADPSKSEWVYEHFLQIVLAKNERGYTELDYLEKSDYDCDIMQRRVIAFEQVKDVDNIVDYLKGCMNDNWQIMLTVDFDCLHEKRIPPYAHFLIQVYIYGYDDDTEEFLGIGFKSDYHFGEIRYGYKEISEAFLSMLKYNKHDIDWVDRYTLLLMQLKKTGEKYKCLPEVVIQGLHDFCYSVDGKDKIRIENRDNARLSSAVFGMNAQEALIKSLEDLLEGKFVVDFRAIHLLKEQKDLMYKKFKYLLKVTKTQTKPLTNFIVRSTEEEQEALKKYEHVCHLISQARLMYMMQVEIDSHSLYGQLKNQEVIKQIISLMEEASKLEKEILSKFLVR